MPKEQNAIAQQRFVEAVEGDYRAFYDAVAPGAVDHDPAPGQGPGPEGFEHFFKELRTAFPDLQVTGEQVLHKRRITRRYASSENDKLKRYFISFPCSN